MDKQTHMSGSIDQIETQLDHDIVFIAQNFRDPVGNPSVRFAVSTGKVGGL